jgi:hypothetical protein
MNCGIATDFSTPHNVPYSGTSVQQTCPTFTTLYHVQSCVQYLFVTNSITATFKPQNIYSLVWKLSINRECETVTVWKFSPPFYHNSTHFPIPFNTLPQPLHIHQTRSAHWIAAQYLVLCDGLTDGHGFILCCGLVISGAALLLDGNQTDSFTLKGGLHRATGWGVECCD